MTFEEFLKLIDTILMRHFQMWHDDLEDYPWNDYFEEDYSPDECRSSASEAVAMWAYDHGFNGDPATYELEQAA